MLFTLTLETTLNTLSCKAAWKPARLTNDGMDKWAQPGPESCDQWHEAQLKASLVNTSVSTIYTFINDQDADIEHHPHQVCRQYKTWRSGWYTIQPEGFCCHSEGPEQTGEFQFLTFFFFLIKVLHPICKHLSSSPCYADYSILTITSSCFYLYCVVFTCVLFHTLVHFFVKLSQ